MESILTKACGFSSILDLRPRLRLTKFAMHSRVDRSKILRIPDGTGDVEISSSSTLGEIKHKLPYPVFKMSKWIDGFRDGWAILEVSGRDPQSDQDREWMKQNLRLLYWARVVGFSS